MVWRLLPAASEEGIIRATRWEALWPGFAWLPPLLSELGVLGEHRPHAALEPEGVRVGAEVSPLQETLFLGCGWCGFARALADAYVLSGVMGMHGTRFPVQSFDSYHRPIATPA